MRKYLKKYIRKIGNKKMIMIWLLMWLNWSVAKINVTLKLLNIYRLIVNSCDARVYDLFDL